MNCARFDEVFGELLNGAASPADEEASTGHLRTCPRCRRRTGQILAVHELLFRQRPRPLEGQVGRVMAAIGRIEESLQSPRPGHAERVKETLETLGVRSPRRRPWLGVAAAALVAAGVLTFFLMRKEPARPGQPLAPSAFRPIARIVHVESAVSVKRRGSEAPERATVGLALGDGDAVETGAGRARIETAPDAVLYANDRTVVRLTAFRAGGVESVLASVGAGEIYVDEDRPSIHVETPDGRVTPRGTRFNVRREGTSTQVVVRDGAVEVRARAQGTSPDPAAGTWVGEPVVVSAGKGSRVTQGLAPSPLPDPDVRAALGWVQEIRQPGRLLCAFESAEDVKIFENFALEPGEAELVRDHATGGTRSLKLTVRPGTVRTLGAAQWLGLPSNWSGHGVLAFDVQARTQVAGSIWVDIRDERNKGLDFRQRSVQEVTLRPGANAVRIPIRGLRTNDGTRTMELGSIWMLLLRWEGAAPGDYYIDSLMLTP